MIKVLSSKKLRNIFIFALVFSICASFIPQTVCADQYDDELARIMAEKAEAEERTASARRKVDDLKGVEGELIDQKMAIEERNTLVVQQITLITRELEVYNAKVEAKEKQVDKAQEEENTQLLRYRARVRAMEEGGRVDFFDLLFNSSSLAQLLSAFDDYSEIMEKDQLVYDELQEAKEALVEAQTELEKTRDEAEEKKSELEAEADSLNQEIEESEAMLEELAAQIQEAEEQLIAAEKAEEQASYAIEEFMKAYYERKQAEEEERKAAEAAAAALAAAAAQASTSTGGNQGETGSSGSSEQPEPSQPSDNEPAAPSDGEVPQIPDTGGSGDVLPDGGYDDSLYGDDGSSTEVIPSESTGGSEPSQDDSGSSGTEPSGSDSQTPAQPDTNSGVGTGSHVWPFPGHYNITSPFGYRESTGTNHTGIDIDGYQSMGQPILASDTGTVIMAQYYGGYGNTIIIDHGNGYSTLYAHLSSMYVSVGSVVTKGQTIAGVGNTGTVYGIDGIHLHYEVMYYGTRQNPSNFVG